MDITVNLELIATQDYKQLLLEELALRDVDIKLLLSLHKSNPSLEIKRLTNEAIRVFNSELKHYKALFGESK